MVEWLRSQWFLLTALVAMGTAWGAQAMKVESLAEAVKQQIVIQGHVNRLREESSRVDERTKAMQEQQRQQYELMQQILEELRDAR